MKTAKLVLVMGLPGTGKTVLSEKVAKDLSLPLVSRDAIKLLILDAVGWKDREWSKKVGKASYDIMDYVVEEHLKSGSSFILESDFKPEFANPMFQKWQEKYGFDCIQVICKADGEALLKRWQDRAASDKHHPSNTEGEQGLEDLRTVIKSGQRQPLDVRGTVITVDTTDFTKVDTPQIIKQIQAALQA